MEALWTSILHNQWLCWGVLPVLSVSIGFVFTAGGLEWLLRTGIYDDKQLLYGKKGKSRKEAVALTWKKLSFSTQCYDAACILWGPATMVNCVISAVLCNSIMPITESTPLLPSLPEFFATFVALLLIGDFGLYWGHWIQHRSKFLWENFHYYHHQIDTPTPVSTISIHPVDATLQGGLPIIFAALIVRPHPLTYNAFIMARVADNAINHSGLETSIFHVLTFKWLPFRGSSHHHDYHHKYSNYSGSAKNFGEYFDIWDRVFGTLAQASLPQSKD